MLEPKHVYFPAAIMSKAWRLARHGARRFGGPARPYLAAALRQAWAEAKATAARIAGQTARVLASIAGLPSDIAACRAAEARFYAGMGPTAEERMLAWLEAEDDHPQLRLAMAA